MFQGLRRLAFFCLLTSLAFGVAAAEGAVDFKNFSYSVTPCGEAGSVTVARGTGTFQQSDTPQFGVSVDRVVTGALGGKPYAVVVLTCKMPVGSNSGVYLFSLNGSTAKYLLTVAEGAADSGYLVDSWVRIRFRDDFLYVDQCENLPSECKTSVVTTYAMRGGKIAKVYVLRHPTAKN